MMLRLMLVLLVSGVMGEERAECQLRTAVEGDIRLVFLPGTGVEVSGEISGLSPGKHGFHVHELGDLSDGCKAAGGHYNPHLVPHGSLTSAVRHQGDLGNILADDKNSSSIHLMANTTLQSLLGRTIVVHEKEDDLGLGGTEESGKTGSAGSRLDCCIITASSQGRLTASLLLILSLVVSFIDL